MKTSQSFLHLHWNAKRLLKSFERIFWDFILTLKALLGNISSHISHVELDFYPIGWGVRYLLYFSSLYYFKESWVKIPSIGLVQGLILVRSHSHEVLSSKCWSLLDCQMPRNRLVIFVFRLSHRNDRAMDAEYLVFWTTLHLLLALCLFFYFYFILLWLWSWYICTYIANNYLSFIFTRKIH